MQVFVRSNICSDQSKRGPRILQGLFFFLVQIIQKIYIYSQLWDAKFKFGRKKRKRILV